MIPTTGGNTFPSPDTYCQNTKITPNPGDKYNQDTGKYAPFRDSAGSVKRRADNRKRPQNYGGHYQDRSQRPTSTAHGILAGTGKQGPHVLAHIAKRTVFELAPAMEANPYTILGSKLAPEPRRAYQMLSDLLKDRGLLIDQDALWKWYQLYKTAYGNAQKQGRGWEYELVKVMELYPLSVYRVGDEPTGPELANKRESASQAYEDIQTVAGYDRSLGIPPGLITVDYGFQGPGGWHQGAKHYHDYIYNNVYYGMGRPPSPSHYTSAPNSPQHT